jgi:hypothetical protein
VWNSRPRLFLASRGRLAHIPDDVSLFRPMQEHDVPTSDTPEQPPAEKAPSADRDFIDAIESGEISGDDILLDGVAAPSVRKPTVAYCAQC